VAQVREQGLEQAQGRAQVLALALAPEPVLELERARGLVRDQEVVAALAPVLEVALVPAQGLVLVAALAVVLVQVVEQELVQVQVLEQARELVQGRALERVLVRAVVRVVELERAVDQARVRVQVADRRCVLVARMRSRAILGWRVCHTTQQAVHSSMAMRACVGLRERSALLGSMIPLATGH